MRQEELMHEEDNQWRRALPHFLDEWDFKLANNKPL